VVVSIAIEKIAIVAAATTRTIFDLFFILLKYSMEFIIFQQNKYFEIMCKEKLVIEELVQRMFELTGYSEPLSSSFEI
jgi:hypothetical protein